MSGNRLRKKQQDLLIDLIMEERTGMLGNISFLSDISPGDTGPAKQFAGASENETADILFNKH